MTPGTHSEVRLVEGPTSKVLGGLLADIMRLYRGDDVQTVDNTDGGLRKTFSDSKYTDVPALWKVAMRADIGARGWSLNPSRYTGSTAIEDDGEDFTERVTALYGESGRLSEEADELRASVDSFIAGVLGA